MVPKHDELMDLIDNYHAEVIRLVVKMVKLDSRDQRRKVKVEITKKLASLEDEMRKFCKTCKGGKNEDRGPMDIGEDGLPVDPS